MQQLQRVSLTHENTEALMPYKGPHRAALELAVAYEHAQVTLAKRQ